MNKYVLAPLGRLFRKPAFVTCTLVLLVCGTGLHVLAGQLKAYLRKEAAPLRKKLDQLDLQKLGPYRLLKALRISEEIEEELGTTDYLQWFLEDTSVPENDPRRRLTLFITYYTGNPDKVPHVPDWCYVGSGGQIEGKTNIEMTVPDNGTPSDQIPARVLEIKLPRMGAWETKTVAYFFSVNGDYRCTRNAVRVRQTRLWDKYAYFSKVEMNLLDPGKMTQPEILQTLEKLAQQLVPILIQDHWPDWDNLNQ